MPTPDLRQSRFCEGCNQTGSITLIPLKKWLAENFKTRNEVPRLLRNRFIVAKKFKGQYFVAWNPNIQEWMKDL